MPRRVTSLDVLRGLAVILVVIHHSLPALIPGQPEVSGVTGFIFWRIKLLGWTGVDLFFVLSGFLIGGLLLNELGRTGSIDVFRFWCRREFKILPSYYFLLLVLAVTQTTGWIRGPFAHFFFLQNYLDQDTNVITWSLAVEEHFYLTLPLILVAVARMARGKKLHSLAFIPALASFFVAICLAMRTARFFFGFHPNDFMMSHFRFDSLFLGVYCQYLWKMHRDRCIQWAARPWPWLACAVVLISPSLFFSPKEKIIFPLGLLTVASGYAIILMLAVTRGMGRFENSRIAKSVAAVGVWSYNIYLWHWFWPFMKLPFYAEVQMYLGRAIPWSGAAAAVQIIVYLSISVLAGYLFTVLIERPFLRLRDQVLPPKAVPLQT